VTHAHARPHPPRLDGVEKAAALLLAMGKPLAARLVKHFDEQELRRLTQAAAGLPPTSQNEVQRLIEDFAQRFSKGADVVGDLDRARGLIDGVLPGETVSDIMADVSGSPKASFWTRATALPDARLVVFLEAEHPQVTAFLLASFEPERTAILLAMLSPRRREMAAERLIGLRKMPDRALHLAEAALERDLFGEQVDASPEKPEARLIEIAAKLERARVEELIAALEASRPDVAAKLRDKMFPFEDIVRITQRERMLVFDKTPTESLILALKDTSEDFREVVLSSLAVRARRMVESELKNTDSAQDKDVQSARSTIERVVVDLIEQGLIQRPAADGAPSA
jgi:flagellar motor switch protein FliG